MKKQLLFYFSFFTIFTATSQLTFVPDDNFEQAIIDLGYDSGPLDDYVPTANIENVTSLFIFNKYIFDLTGIEDFTDLTILDCSGNNLDFLDLSNNVALTWLDCSTNHLGLLNISNNISLTSLGCRANQLAFLDLSNNISLTTLGCQSNQLTSLDLSNNTVLTGVNCSSNQLTSINLFQNSLLEHISISYNQLIELDISQNTNIDYLFCKNNQLTYLDMRNGNNEGFPEGHFNSINNPNLTCIFVDDAAYSTTNWTQVDPASTFVETEAECDALAVNDFKETCFNIYPNPANNILNIETNTPFSKTEIYTILGQKVVESSAKNIDVSNLNAGLYILVIEGESGNTMVKRFVKQ